MNAIAIRPTMTLVKAVRNAPGKAGMSKMGESDKGVVTGAFREQRSDCALGNVSTFPPL